MTRDLALSIDVGTGSARAALVDGGGRILAIAAKEHEQIVPQFGWSEQRPADWWAGVVQSVRTVLDQVEGARGRIAAVCACGQMHGTVLVDDTGALTRDTVPLWNDKRTLDLVAAFERDHAPDSYLAESGNPPTPAWPGFKLAWIRDHDPEAYRRAAAVMMPKDYVNFRLTGEIAMEATEGSCSFLMNPATRDWSPAMIALLGLDAAKLPRLRPPLEILGGVTATAAVETGLLQGTPVLVGGADYPMALLGSGACRPGLVSDVTGTSSIITLITGAPLLDPEICNVATIEGGWGPFVLLESGGDAMRWARRAFHEGALGYAEIVAKAAEAAPGAGGLFFLPYLVGERLGAHRNARAQFFGLGAGHGLAELHRAVLEGVAFAVTRHIRVMEAASGRPLDRLIASGGGAKTELWLKIKASATGLPILVPEEAECGVVGCAAMVAAATGRFATVQDAAGAFVRYGAEIAPDPAWAERYARMQPVFDKLYRRSQALYDDLDRLED
ncbi:xylulokinase [Inquilinus ginsengisoli]|uniref:xylulokinase n=1 Tax=Inquilinus ginsengisoli TaxID=363840 RepID=UPI003D1DB384